MSFVPVQADRLTVDISPPVQTIETLTKDSHGVRAERVTTYTSLGNQLSTENELRAELAAYRAITNTEFAAQDALAESYNRQLKVEAVAMLQHQQAESQRVEREHAAKLRDLQLQAEAYQMSISAEHQVANHLYEQKLEQSRQLEAQVLHQQEELREHHAARDVQRTPSPDRTLPYTTPTHEQMPKGSAEVTEVQHFAMDTDEKDDEIDRLRIENEKLIRQVKNAQDWANHVTLDLGDVYQQDQGWHPQTPSTPTRPSHSWGNPLLPEAAPSGRVLRGERVAEGDQFWKSNLPTKDRVKGAGGIDPSLPPNPHPFYGGPPPSLNVKEAEHLTIKRLPNMRDLADWKMSLWENVSQCSTDPDMAFQWIKETETKDFQALYNNAPFPTLDSKLAHALSQVISGALQRQIQLLKTEYAQQNLRLRGRQMLWTVLEHYRVSHADTALKDLDDLFSCYYIVKDQHDLSRFISKWDKTILLQRDLPGDNILEVMFRRQIDQTTSLSLKRKLENYDELPSGSPDKGYEALLRLCKRHLELEHQQRNRQALLNTPEERANAAKGGYCWDWASKGDCTKKDCPYASTHTAEMRNKDKPKGKGRSGKSRSKSPNRSSGKGKDKNIVVKGKGKGKPKGKDRTGSPSPGRNAKPQICRDYMQGKCTNPCPHKRFHPEDCWYYSHGTCTRGDKCGFRHVNHAHPVVANAQQDHAKPKRKRSRGRSRSPGKGQQKGNSTTPTSTTASAGVFKALLCRMVTHPTASMSEEQCFVSKEQQLTKVAEVTSSCLRTRTTQHHVRFPRNLTRTIIRHQEEPTVGYDEKRYGCEAKEKYPYKRKRQSLKKALYQAQLLQRQVRSFEKPTTNSWGNPLTPSESATPVKEWILDSGASQDLVSRQNLSNKEQNKIKKSDERCFQTANGTISIGDRIDMNVKSDGATISTRPFVLDECPAILSLGQRIADGYSFEWSPGSTPTLTAPNGRKISLKVDNYVPVITSEVLRILAASSNETTDHHDAEQVEESPANASDQDHDETDHSQLPKGAADTDESYTPDAMHMLTHFPKDPKCPVCSNCKITKKPCKRNQDPDADKPEKFGEAITADHMIAGRDESSYKGDTVTCVILDRGTGWLQAFPAKAKSAAETKKAFMRFTNETPKRVYTDGSHEFKAAMLDLNWPHDVSTPHRPQTNGIVERTNRRILEGARCALFQSGLASCIMERCYNDILSVAELRRQDQRQDYPRNSFWSQIQRTRSPVWLQYLV